MKIKLNIRDVVRQAADSDNMLTFEACVDVDNLLETAQVPDEPEIDLHDLLDEQRAIALVWDAQMVRSTYPHLTDDQAWEVLQECERSYSAEHGLTWDDVGDVVAERFPDPDGFLMPGRVARCEQALKLYTDTDDANLRDLLTDLMHWSRRCGQSFDDALEMAHSHFTNEARQADHTRWQAADKRSIAQVWTVDDVRQVRPDLTDDQAYEVLKTVDRRQDASVGITFGTLETVADELFPDISSGGKE